MQTFDRVAIKAEAKNKFYQNRSACVSMALAGAVAQLILTGVSAGFLSVLLSGIIAITLGYFYLRVWREDACSVGEAVSAVFDDGFLRKLGGMLWMQLKVFLWSLLFIIPGIIKSLGYALTPFILNEYPNIPAMEASRISERMMRGHKMDLFITELSFLGWELLSALTFGIVYVLFAGSYMGLTYAGIYDELKQLALEEGVVTPAELDGHITY